MRRITWANCADLPLAIKEMVYAKGQPSCYRPGLLPEMSMGFYRISMGFFCIPVVFFPDYLEATLSWRPSIQAAALVGVPVASMVIEMAGKKRDLRASGFSEAMLWTCDDGPVALGIQLAVRSTKHVTGTQKDCVQRTC